MSSTIPISVILATTEPWPDLAHCLEVLGPQVRALGGEIIVGDGDGGALNTVEAAKYPELRWIRMPGASVFEMRARAIDQAQGDVIALTEDHCLVGNTWCAEVLRAFATHPDALAFTGPVLNGSQETRTDRANFLFVFGFTMPPVNLEQRERPPVIANSAFRKNVFPPAPMPIGWLEFDGVPDLFRRGAYRVWDQMTVTHVQSHGVFGTYLAHFDNGRSAVGISGVPFSHVRSPWRLYWSAKESFSKGEQHAAMIRSLRGMLVLLCCAHSLGEFLGWAFGPGGSSARVR